MRTLTRTIVAWNGSDAAEAALQWAVRRTPRGTVILVHASTGSGDPIRGMLLSSKAESTREIHPGLSISAVTVEVDLVVALAGFSDAETLLVIGEDERGNDLSARVLEVARGPVAIIPARSFGGRAGVVVRIGRLPEATPLLTFAASEAGLAGEDLVIVHDSRGEPDDDSREEPGDAEAGAGLDDDGAPEYHEPPDHDDGLEERDRIEHALHGLRRMHPLLVIHALDLAQLDPEHIDPEAILDEARTAVLTVTRTSAAARSRGGSSTADLMRGPEEFVPVP